MPYSCPGDPDLPDHIKAKPAKLRRQWVEVFNSAYDDCQQDGGEDCDGAAMQTANGVIKKAEGDNMSNLIVTHDFLLAEARTGKPIEVLTTGTFTDRNGKKVKITETDLEEFAANFEAGEAGQDVPIDVDHEKSAAAGWIKRVWKDGNKLLVELDWTSLGEKLVKDKIYRYVSAWIDMGNKVIKSISLVNFPAVKGLKPVELSEGLYYFADGTPGSVRVGQFIAGHIHKIVTQISDDLFLSGFLSTDERKQFSSALGDALESLENGLGDAKERLIRSMDWFRPPRPDMADGEFIENTQNTEENTMSDEERARLKEELRQKIEAELAQQQQTRAELREEVRQDVEAELREVFNRRQGLIEFANEICGGEFGLSTPPDEVVELLENIPVDQLEKIKTILKAKVVEFGERGSSQDGKTKKGGAKLPEYAIKDVETGQFTVAELFNHNVLAGKPGDYDLSEFSEEQRGGV